MKAMLISVRASRRGFTPTRVGTTAPIQSVYLSPSVHPHTRGDHQNSRLPAAASAGSPPHAWGPRIRSGASDLCGRFTPTRVGTT